MLLSNFGQIYGKHACNLQQTTCYKYCWNFEGCIYPRRVVACSLVVEHIIYLIYYGVGIEKG